jgi:signal transduction histidine kinase
MRALASLTNRIFLACTLLATLSLGFAFYFVIARVSSEAEAELRRGLSEASTLVDQHRMTQTDAVTRQAHLVADLPKLEAAVATGDPPTVQPVAEDYRKITNADLLIVADPAGHVLGAASADATAMQAAATLATAPDEASAFWPHSRGVLQVVSVPIRLEARSVGAETLGRLTMGFFLDDHFAQQVKELTGSEIAFGAGGRILASTLPAEARGALSTLVNSKGISTLRLGREEFIALSRPMEGSAVTDRDAPATLILRSRTERLRFLDTIRTGLAGVLVVTLLLATIVSYAVARTMTRPLAAITSGMREIATTGDLTRKVTLHPRGWDDEDARLLATTFNTLTESIVRFQTEVTQRERLSSLGRLSTVIAHEIRNPLMIIKAALNSLRRERVHAAELREAVADIDEEIGRLNRIVTEVLDFARPMRFECADASINGLCTASAAAATAGEPEPSVALDLDASDPHIITDAERLRTALVNIVANARHAVDAKALTQSGVAVFRDAPIRIETRAIGDDRIRISVIDQGAGIAPQDLDRVFEPYFTTRRTGTGLGLPIARNIIEGLGGTIAVASRVGEGTRIDIVLTSQRTGRPA